jgi:putative aldouronate transport system substrate-binding protein
LWKYTKEDYAPYAKKEILPLGMFMNEDQAAKNAEIWTSIDNYVTMAMIKFVTGEWDFDKQWDNYVNELNKLGAKDYVKIRQDIYNQKMKNRK